MKKIIINVALSIFTIIFLTSCERKKNTVEKTEHIKDTDSLKKEDHENSSVISNKSDNILSYNSYTFAENLKNDNFFESDHINKEIELKNIGITTYFISDDQVTLIGIFYDKQKNIAIPRFENNPPNRSFVPDYFDKKQINYDEKYKNTYSSTLRISLKNQKDVQKLKMYISSERVLNYESKVEGSLDEYRTGFLDIIDIRGNFRGLSPDGIYPNKLYEISDAIIN